MSEQISNLKGERGFTVVTSDNPASGKFDVLKAVGGDVVVTSLKGAIRPLATSFDGKTISNGDSVPGRFTNVVVTSGTLLAYEAD